MIAVNVLGSRYEIYYREKKEDPELKGLDGYTDFTARKIVICRQEREKASDEVSATFLEKETLRHELIHAFLHESGLSYCSLKAETWAANEEMVDWLALQMPKIVKAMKEVGAL